MPAEAHDGPARATIPCLVFGDQRPDLWQQVVWYLHEGLNTFLEGVFGGRLCFGLMSIPTL
jgi:hypothetical protein